MCVQTKMVFLGSIAHTNRLALFQFCTSPPELVMLLAGRYKRAQFNLPHTSPRVWGWGRRRWALVRGPSLTSPLFVFLTTANLERRGRWVI